LPPKATTGPVLLLEEYRHCTGAAKTITSLTPLTAGGGYEILATKRNRTTVSSERKQSLRVQQDLEAKLEKRRVLMWKTSKI